MEPHTFTSAFEDAEELETLIAGAVDFYRPQNPQEQFAVARIALCQLSILRAYRLEAGALTSSFNAGIDAPRGIASGTAPLDQKNNQTLAAGFHQETKAGPSWSVLLRYQAQADRQYRRAIEDFNRLAAARPEVSSDPLPAPEPEETAPLPRLIPPRRDVPTGPRPVSAASPTSTPKPPRREAPTGPRPPAPGPRREAPGPWARSAPPAKIESCLPKNINHEIWRHRLSRQQLRSRRVLRRRHQSRAEGGVYLA